jgi:hypothetical protein
MLHRVCVCVCVCVCEREQRCRSYGAASTFIVKIGDRMYLRNVCNIAHAHTVFLIVFLSLLGKYWDGDLKGVCCWTSLPMNYLRSSYTVYNLYC